MTDDEVLDWLKLEYPYEMTSNVINIDLVDSLRDVIVSQHRKLIEKRDTALKLVKDGKSLPKASDVIIYRLCEIAECRYRGSADLAFIELLEKQSEQRK